MTHHARQQISSWVFVTVMCVLWRTGPKPIPKPNMTAINGSCQQISFTLTPNSRVAIISTEDVLQSCARAYVLISGLRELLCWCTDNLATSLNTIWSEHFLSASGRHPWGGFATNMDVMRLLDVFFCSTLNYVLNSWKRRGAYSARWPLMPWC